MVKFCEEFVALDPSIVGRVDSVRREVNLLTRTYDGEKTFIKKNMHTLKTRTFVSAYCGRICIGTIMLNQLPGRLSRKKGRWHIANAVVDKRARRCGLGKNMADIALRSAFINGCREVYLGAALEEEDDSDPYNIIYQMPKESGAYRFWKRLNFKPVPMKRYNELLRERGLEGVYPMKMSKRMQAAKNIPQLETSLAHIFPALRRISKNLDGKDRVPTVRICTPMLGDIKITETTQDAKNKEHRIVFH